MLVNILTVSHRKSILIFNKTILAFNSIPGVGVQKFVPVVIITIGGICFQLNLIQKIFIYGAVGTNFASAHYCFTGHLPRVKAAKLYIGGKGGPFKLFFSNELSFRAINRRVNTIWRLYIRGGGEMIVLRFSFSTRVPFYGVSLCPYSKFHIGRGMLPFLFFSFQGWCIASPSKSPKNKIKILVKVVLVLIVMQAMILLVVSVMILW